MINKADTDTSNVFDGQTSNSGNKISSDDMQTIKARNPKVDFSKPELLKLMCYMEGELQARDIVIAVLKVSFTLKHFNIRIILIERFKYIFSQKK